MRLVVLALALSGCLIKPDRVSLSDSGSGGFDAHVIPDAAATFVPRVLVNAYYSDQGNSPMMDATQYGLDLPAIQDGELLLLVGNVDNAGVHVELARRV